jgi:mRNA-degrading endonuclease RelE of RelBE toxin-antitoxin system
LGDPKIINLLIENNADLNSLNESGLSVVNYLFSENDVETIKQVIPHIDREKYEDILGHHIVNGLHVEVKKKYRKLAVSEQQLKREEKIINVAKYIVDELANQKNITTALSYLCRGTAVQYRVVYNDAFDYLRPHLKVMTPEAAIGCVSAQDNPIGGNGKYVIENMLSLLDSGTVNEYIDASNMDKGYGFKTPRKKERKKSPAEVWKGMRLLDIAASRNNEVAVYYLLEASADTSLVPAQKSYINKSKAELVGKVNNIFNGVDEDVSDIDLETELSRTDYKN